jgi:hypothetical protein
MNQKRHSLVEGIESLQRVFQISVNGRKYVRIKNVYDGRRDEGRGMLDTSPVASSANRARGHLFAYLPFSEKWSEQDAGQRNSKQ